MLLPFEIEEFAFHEMFSAMTKNTSQTFLVSRKIGISQKYSAVFRIFMNNIMKDYNRYGMCNFDVCNLQCKHSCIAD